MSEEWQFHGYTLREIYNSLGFLCQATLTNGKTFSGHLYNIDPETFTVLILQLPPTQAQEQEQGQSSEQTSAGKDESGGVTNKDANGEKPQDQELMKTQAQVSPLTSQTPLNSTTIMSTSNQGGVRTTMVAIRQHALKTFSIDTSVIEGHLTTETMETLAGLPAPPSISPVDIESRKQSIITMLESQRIPWKTTASTGDQEQEGNEGDVIQLLVGGARIKPPYTTSTVDCSNKVILERVQGMIREHDFNKKEIIASSS